ncbi:carbohydrate phosphatase [Aspergillus ambiguus]|uniref:carbohydrate phosphatase n=1 Tax=Aspergillus ambiguus TaxID=176160 RepID=UPI003CCDB0E5
MYLHRSRTRPTWLCYCQNLESRASHANPNRHPAFKLLDPQIQHPSTDPHPPQLLQINCWTVDFHTMDTPYAQELQLACLTVQRASLLTKKVLDAVDKGALDKSDSSPVTIADFAAQALIIAAIHHVFPDDDIVGEEDSKALRKDPGLLDRTWDLVASMRSPSSALHTPTTKEEMLDLIDLGAKGSCSPHNRAWVLDPVDGTATFIRGQQYAVCLALVEQGRQRLGVLGCPNLSLDILASTTGHIHEDAVDRNGYGTQVFAVAGHGAYTRIMTASPAELGPAQRIPTKQPFTDPRDIVFVDCTATTSSDIELHERLAARLGAPWPPATDVWSAQLRYVAIAVGGCNVLLKIPRKRDYRSNIWDHAGGMLIAQEAGCRVSDLAGNEVDCGAGRRLGGCYGMVVAPEGIHARLVEGAKEFV